MEKFLTENPQVARILISLLGTGLVYVVLAYAKVVVDNNTDAMHDLATALEKVVERVNDHDISLAEHEVRIGRLEEDDTP